MRISHVCVCVCVCFFMSADLSPLAGARERPQDGPTPAFSRRGAYPQLLRGASWRGRYRCRASRRRGWSQNSTPDSGQGVLLSPHEGDHCGGAIFDYCKKDRGGGLPVSIRDRKLTQVPRWHLAYTTRLRTGVAVVGMQRNVRGFAHHSAHAIVARNHA